MAKQKGKPQKSKPITANPLFPAVAALWCGALLGLSSLAVRRTLLESVIVKSHIDLVIPAAAPPLGLTARILLALGLSAIGALLGAALARRIARPKPEARERKRGARNEAVQIRARDSHPDAPARNPISAHDELEDRPGLLPNRRRALTVEHEEDSFVPHEMAPLPGGQPQIFDIAGMKLGESDNLAPLDLGSFAEDQGPAPGALSAPEPAPTAAAPLDWANARPVEVDPSAPPPSLPAAALAPAEAPEVPRQVFQPSDSAPPEAHPDPNHEAAMAGRQVFGMNPVPPTPVEQRQVFGAPIENDHVSPDFIKAAGYQTTVFDTPEPAPLFARDAGATVVSTAPEPAQPTLPAPTASPAPIPPAVPQAYEPAPPAQPAAQAPVVAEAPLPPIAGLGITDLAGRLAESMRRRRAARAASQVSAEPVEANAPAPATEPVAEPARVEPALRVPEAYVPALNAEPLPEGIDPVGFAAPTAPVLPSTAEPDAETAAAPVESAEAIAPAAPVPAAFTPPAEPAEFRLPRALRPLDLGAQHDDGAELDSLLPPRRLSAASFTPLSAGAMNPAPPVAEQPDPVVSELAPSETDEPEVAEAAADEDNYGSLLSLGQTGSRSGFVRIDEPEGSDSIEPVVIFPGQNPRGSASAGTPFVAPIAPVEAEEPSQFRRFDAPASAGQGQQIAATALQPGVEGEEAERALRAALANLQRMSGAA